jgi:hypothetical protein
MAARELPRVRLDDALKLVILMEAQDEDDGTRFARAAAKWAARFALENPTVSLDDLRAAVDALDKLPDDDAEKTLAGLLRGQGHGGA